MLVIAHRGASASEPENSLAAFGEALALGADGVELDVHAASDGHIVVHHDPVLGGRRIADSSIDEIREHRLVNGETIPTLPQALDLLGPTASVFIEIKTLTPEHDDRLLGAITAGPAPGNYHVHSFDHRIVQRVLGACEGLEGGVLSTSYPVNPLIQLEQTGASTLWQSDDLVDDELVAAVHAFGAKIIPWTVDDPVRIAEFVDMGVDGICTNHPELVRELLT